MGAYRKILVAVDGSPAAEKGLREAIRVAGAGASALVVVHVVNEFYAYTAMEGAGLGTDVQEPLREAGRGILEKARTLAARRRLEPKLVMREISGGPAGA